MPPTKPQGFGDQAEKPPEPKSIRVPFNRVTTRPQEYSVEAHPLDERAVTALSFTLQMMIEQIDQMILFLTPTVTLHPPKKP